ncbi:hypothetical protein [Mesorhizobium sp. CN2-181]|uniref:hypothetical protein n=1 Tax=Mesorhizobium yinganensis TaxID=3157707 RepID=UPI0032B812A4
MATVRLLNIDGDEMSVPERISGDDFDAPTVTFVVCDAGQFIDPDSAELRFIPAPQPPEIEQLVTLSGDGRDMDTGGHDVDLEDPTGNLLKESDEFYLALFGQQTDALDDAPPARRKRFTFDPSDWNDL